MKEKRVKNVGGRSIIAHPSLMKNHRNQMSIKM